MRGGIRSPFEFLSMSTLDLFASMLGTFVLIAFVLLPYYLRQPALEADVAEAKSETAATVAELRLLRERLTGTQGARAEAEATLIAAQRRLAAAASAAQHVQSAPEPPEAFPARKPGAISIPPLDLVIVIDTTGSMRDDLMELQAAFLGIIRILHRLSPAFAVGVVAYRDYGEEYLTRTFPLVPIGDRALPELLSFLQELRAAGGGDPPEAMEVGLAEALKMPWRDRTMGRIVVVADEPPHPADLQTALDLAARFRSTPQHAVGTVYVNEEQDPARLFFERLASAGGGDFRMHRGEMIESVLLSVLGGIRKH
jgi:von Willebrand factor type A domain